MGETTGISWADATVNFWLGCTVLSPACDGCYARALVQDRFGRATWGGPGLGAGTRTRTSAATWALPFKLARKARRLGTRPFVFVNSLADIFDNAVPAEWRRDAFDVMRRTPRLVYLLLTKRPQLIVRLIDQAGGLPPNCAIGTTVEDQERAINLFHLACAAKDLRPIFTFASFEPMLGPVDPTRIVLHDGPAEFFDHPEIRTTRILYDALRGAASMGLPALGWAITGGETSQGAHKARPTLPDWERRIRDDCAAAGTPFHRKQAGEWLEEGDWYADHPVSLPYLIWTGTDWTDDGAAIGPGMVKIGKNAAGRLLDGVLHDARPAVPVTEAEHV